MSDALRLAGFALAAALCLLSLRAVHKEMGSVVAAAAGVILLGAALTKLAPAVEALRSLAQKAQIGQETVVMLWKLIGIAYLTEFAAQTCREAGEDGLAMKTAFCGKSLLLAQTLPLLIEIGQMTLALTA